MDLGTATILRANARDLPIPDNSVDLIVTSPPYFALRSYQDGGAHYDGQLGSEPTPAEFLDALIEVTAECVRVLKPSGSLWVNLGDSYSRVGGGGAGSSDGKTGRGERPSRRAVRQDMTREQAAWLAGVIDSDGSVSIHVNKQPEGRAPSFVAWTRVGQMRPEVVRRAAEVTGVGQVYQDKRGVWNWSASAQQARWVLSRIYPWLTIKQRQAAAAIEVARHVEECNGRGAYRRLEPADIAYRQRLRDAVLAWNRGEDDALDPPVPRRVPLPIYENAPREKSLNGLPWMYAQECIGRLGLILRAEVIWSKPNGLPESVTDRVRRSHEQWFHFTRQPRYFSAVDEIREPHARIDAPRPFGTRNMTQRHTEATDNTGWKDHDVAHNPLGKLPGSVWTVPTEPLRVPESLGVDHFAAFPSEWPKRLILGWSPRAVCSDCGFLLGSSYDSGMLGVRRELRASHSQRRASDSVLLEDVLEPSHLAESEVDEVSASDDPRLRGGLEAGSPDGAEVGVHDGAPTCDGRAPGQDAPARRGCSPQERSEGGQPDRESGTPRQDRARPTPEAGTEALPLPSLWRHDPDIRDALACPHCGSDRLSRPVVADIFGGTGTTALVAKALGRHGISVDLSADYCRLATWRTNNRDQLAKVLGIAKSDAPTQEEALF